MLKAREAPSAELERLRLMIPKSRSTTRKKGYGEKPRVRERHEFFFADRGERGNRVVVGEG
jgi:hypothetical protein